VAPRLRLGPEAELARLELRLLVLFAYSSYGSTGNTIVGSTAFLTIQEASRTTPDLK